MSIISALRRPGAVPLLDGARLAWLTLFGLGLLFLFFYPLWANPYGLSVVRDALIFGLFALSLDYLWGKAGVLSFGHAAFFGLGAYGTAVFAPMVGGGNAALAGMAGAILLTAAVALLIGYFLLFGGVRGAHLTIVTLAVSLVASHIAVGWSSVTGGDAGLIGTPPPGIELFGVSFVFIDPVDQFYLVTGVCAAALLGLWIACRGHYGRVLAAIQDNELRAQTLGYDTAFHLLVVFVISAALAALAGGLYAALSGYVAPAFIGLLLSTEVIVWVAIGGRGTLLGPFIGAIVVQRLQQEVSSIDIKLWPIIIGAFFVAMVFLFPRGLLPLFERIGAQLAIVTRSSA
jgi:ABC-type branched-subunit amino acid transport system permease subunit